MVTTTFMQPDNQVPDLENYNLFTCDPALHEALDAFSAAEAAPACSGYGERLGSKQVLQLAQRANLNEPQAAIFTRTGERQDAVTFDPAWHSLLAMLFEMGVHSAAWQNGQHVRRAALFYLHAQTEAGSLCPVTMTFAAVAALQGMPLLGQLAPLLYSCDYDGTNAPISQKRSMMIGMGMTERQGGSDVRSNTTYATAIGRAEPVYELHGHKWFFSSPMSDAHLVLAYEQEQQSCFYVPRWRPDGTRNAVHIQRLKNKLGNRSNASAEVTFDGAWALRVGELGAGVPTILRMVNQTRLDCVLGSAGLLRQGLVQAMHHARYRMTFGKRLADQPLMQSVLCDLALESEAAMWLGLALAHAVAQQNDPVQKAFLRFVAPAAKFWVCKRSIAAIAECMEVWGGNGYVEDAPLARLLREAPVNSIWEGSGNIMCLDVLRAFARDAEGAVLVLDHLADDCGADPVLAQAMAQLKQWLSEPASIQQARAREITQRLVLLVQATLLYRHAPPWMAEAFVRARFEESAGVIGASVYTDAVAILERAYQPA
ncbi:acyl-CoA dehydrogenase family protein [Advenella mimigardefordensis]|uniref:Acyl-CoA dehydrogenase n=1 Tax=Advenella mimigardefordensis (strain DSM 17166 / LMG 22922 / DPN7) TaxID=1247726 RepID=W0PII7_ADVMD|nr:acyl-CoA dehydrogenase family protein [Advenella mimigardefordensis]AHG65747.1 acyl-CoA dehydrogenase [Advenella mimigardefordensis DPN7]